jgi:hypothetical protein
MFEKIKNPAKIGRLSIFFFSSAVATALLAAACFGSSGRKEHALQDPGIPGGEKIVYASACESSQDTITENTVTKTLNGKAVYEITVRSGFQDKTISLDKSDMDVLAVKTTKRAQDVTVDVTTVINSGSEAYDKEAIHIADISALRYQLRGYPFEQAKSLKVTTLISQDEISMKVKMTGTETIEVLGKPIECYRLEFSVGGILGMFLPKTTLWYSKARPHFLARYNGSSERKRTKKCSMEIIRYEAGDK